MIATLTPAQIAEVQSAVVSKLIDHHHVELDLISPAQLSGILDLSLRTILTLDIPRVTIVPNKIYRFRLSDVKAWLEKNRA